eukprot:scaffold265313_cov35-Tisochrysis_lutea.AAC.2
MRATSEFSKHRASWKSISHGRGGREDQDVRLYATSGAGASCSASAPEFVRADGWEKGGIPYAGATRTWPEAERRGVLVG